MVTILHGLALALYVVAAGVLAGSLAEGRRSVPRLGGLATVGGAAAHGAGLVGYTLVYGEAPLIGLAPSLATLGFVIAVSLLVATAFRESKALGLVLLPLAASLLAVALALGVAPAGEALVFRGAWFQFHVVLGFVGFAALSVAFAAGLLYLLQFRELKGKHLGRIFRFLPALDTLDRVGRLAVAVGFPSLSVALALGWAWTVRFQNSFAVRDPQVIWGVLTWLTFVGLVWARSVGRGRGRRGAVASVVGFVVVIVAYIVLRIATAEGPRFL